MLITTLPLFCLYTHLQSFAQADPIKYLHVGMLQHDPDGLPIFLHRTAEGKFYPFQQGFRKVRISLAPRSD